MTGETIPGHYDAKYYFKNPQILQHMSLHDVYMLSENIDYSPIASQVGTHSLKYLKMIQEDVCRPIHQIYHLVIQKRCIV
jgi:hypothetical protein